MFINITGNIFFCIGDEVTSDSQNEGVLFFPPLASIFLEGQSGFGNVKSACTA